MARRANRKDNNHKEITDIIAILRDKYHNPIHFVDTHEKKKYIDFDLQFGGTRSEDAVKDRSDWILGCNGTSIGVEVKQKGKLITAGEDEYLNRCRGSYIKIENFDDLIEGLGFFIFKASDWEAMIKMTNDWRKIKEAMSEE